MTAINRTQNVKWVIIRSYTSLDILSSYEGLNLIKQADSMTKILIMKQSKREQRFMDC